MQISDENLQGVLDVMDEVFGRENRVATLAFKKTAGQTARLLASTADFICWYARDAAQVKFRRLFTTRELGDDSAYSMVELTDGSRRRLSSEERANFSLLPDGARVYRLQTLQSPRQGRAGGPGSAMHFPVEIEGRSFFPSGSQGWKTTREGMLRLTAARRVAAQGNGASYVRYFADFPAVELSSFWPDTQSGSSMDKLYVVQTNEEVVRRCMLMSTDPGDLIVDPTCGSGTTA